MIFEEPMIFCHDEELNQSLEFKVLVKLFIVQTMNINENYAALC